MEEVPIACTLTGGEARARVEEWAVLLTSSITRGERVSPTELALHLHPDLRHVAALMELAGREKTCCPFFDFSISIDTDAVVLHVTVPDDAAPLLDDFLPAGAPP